MGLPPKRITSQQSLSKRKKLAHSPPKRTKTDKNGSCFTKVEKRFSKPKFPKIYWVAGKDLDYPERSQATSQTAEYRRKRKKNGQEFSKTKYRHKSILPQNSQKKPQTQIHRNIAKFKI